MTAIMTDPARATRSLETVRVNDLSVAAGYEGILLANSLDTLDGLFVASTGDSLTKPGLSPWRERIRLTLTVDDHPTTFYLKRFSNPPARFLRETRKSASGALSTAGVEWVWMNLLARDGIPCVRPVAFGEELVGSRERRSAILTEAVPGQSLERWMIEWSEADRSLIRGLIEPTAALIARLHACGYVHRDLYLSHVFFDPAAAMGQSLHLIDLQRVFRPSQQRRRWIVKELASLNFSAPANLVSTADRMRWLKQYLGVSKLDGSGKRLAYRVVGKTCRIASHERRRQARFRSERER